MSVALEGSYFSIWDLRGQPRKEMWSIWDFTPLESQQMRLWSSHRDRQKRTNFWVGDKELYYSHHSQCHELHVFISSPCSPYNLDKTPCKLLLMTPITFTDDPLVYLWWGQTQTFHLSSFSWTCFQGHIWTLQPLAVYLVNDYLRVGLFP